MHSLFLVTELSVSNSEKSKYMVFFFFRNLRIKYFGYELLFRLENMNFALFYLKKARSRQSMSSSCLQWSE